MSVHNLLDEIESQSSSLVPSKETSEGTGIIQSRQGGSSSTLSSLNQKQELNYIVEQVCNEFPVSAKEVIDNLLSIEDELDIIEGNIPEETLKAHIKVWLEAGKPKLSGKNL